MPTAPLIHDLQEQVLTAPLSDGTRNGETGCESAAVVLFDEERDTFEMLDSETESLLTTHSAPCSTSINSNISKYIEDVADYVDDNGKMTGGDTNNFSDDVQVMLQTQATPATVGGWTPCIDVGLDWRHECDPFLTSKRRAADLVIAHYNRFSQKQKSFGIALGLNRTTALTTKNLFPVADRFPWFNKHYNKYCPAVRLLQQYLRAVQPLIVDPYGQKPTCLARVLFTEKSRFDGQPKDSAAPVGVPVLTSFPNSYSHSA